MLFTRLLFVLFLEIVLPLQSNGGIIAKTNFHGPHFVSQISVDGIKANQYNTQFNDSMKIRDLVILIKYAQGLVIFDSYVKFVRFVSPAEKQLYFTHINSLIIGMDSKENDIADAIILSDLAEDCKPCEILKHGGINLETLKTISQYSEIDLESSFKLLLSVFTVRYQRRYTDNVNDPYRFWYWDFAKTENTIRLINSFNDEDKVDLMLF